MITLTNGSTTQPGTVICGTMQPQTLTIAFLSELKACGYDWSIHQDYLWSDVDYTEKCDFCFDLLEELAPEGYYFGAHPGDGADFGWWQYEDYDNE